MKIFKILLSLVCLLCLSTIGNATITRVQFKHVYTGTSGAFTSNVTAGNLIVVWISGSDGSGTDASCSDSLGNTYTKIGQVLLNRTNAAMYYAYNITGGANTVTVSAGTSDKGFTAVEYSSSNGSFSTDPLDAGGVTSFVSGSASPLTLTKTLSATGLLFAGWADEVINKQNGWTSNLTQIQKDTTHYDGTAEGLNKSAATYTEGVTVVDTTSNSNVVGLAVFKEPASSGTNTSRMFLAM